MQRSKEKLPFLCGQAGVAEETVGRLPEGIDGLRLYHIKNYHDIDALQRWKKMEKKLSNGMERSWAYALR